MEAKSSAARLQRAALTPFLLVILLLGATPAFAQRCDHCNKDGLEMPISLEMGTVRTPAFPVENAYYNIAIDVRWLLPREELRCKMGFAVSPSDMDCEGKSLLWLSWKVTDGSRIVAEGVDRGRSEAFYANHQSLGRYIGRFKGTAKHQYIVEITFKRDASQLGVTQPHLIVSTPDSW